METTLFLVLLYSLAISNLVAGECDVYNQEELNIERCLQLQRVINHALVTNEENMYILEKVFRSTKPHPGIALVINYHICYKEAVHNTMTTESTNYSDDDHNSTNVDDEGNSTICVCHQNKSAMQQIQVGLSKSGIFTAIRPAILLALQPEIILVTLSITIHNIRYPQTINLWLTIKEGDLPQNTSEVELREALEHLTERLDYNATGRLFYTWNPSTSSLAEVLLIETTVVFTIGSFVILILTSAFFIQPKHLTVNFKRKTRSFIMSTSAIVWAIVIVDIEFWIIISVTTDTPHYSTIRFTVISVKLVMGVLIVIIVAIIRRLRAKHSVIKCSVILANIYVILTFWLLATFIAIDLIPLIIFTIIYPVEVISFTSFATAMIIGIATARYLHRSGIKLKILWSIIIMAILSASYCLLLLHLSILRSISDSPVSHFSQIALSFTPAALATLVGYMLNKKLGSNKNTNTSTESHENADDHHQETNSSDNNVDESREQEGEQSRSDGQQQERRSVAQEDNSSLEVQEEAELHQDINSDSHCESTV